MGEVALSLMVILSGAVALALIVQRWKRNLQLIAWLGFFAHVAGTYALVFVVRDIYGVGDLLSYLRQGRQLADYVRLTGNFDDLFAVIAGRQPVLPFLLLGAGSPTGSTSGLTGLLVYVLESDWAVNYFVGLLAFSGQLCGFLGLRPYLEEHLHPRLLGAALLLPSAVFWTSGVLKESYAVAGLGWLVYAASALDQRKVLRAVVLGGVGALLAGLTKPYVLFPFALSCGVFVYWRAGLEKGGGEFSVRPSRLVLGAIIAVVGVAVLGELFPRYSVSNLGEEAARAREMGAMAGGGSYFESVDTQQRSLVGQLAYTPIALISSLFRPFPFEISSAAVAVNAVETTALLVLFGRLLVKLRPGGIWRRIQASPTLMFCFSMTLLMGVGIGLTTTNMGTLSRYRVPMMPFYIALLLILSAPSTAAAPSPSLRPERRTSSQRSTIRSRL